MTSNIHSFKVDTNKAAYEKEINYHKGIGSILRRQIFNKESSQLSTLQIWDIGVGSSESMHVHGKNLLNNNELKDDRPELGELEEIYYCISGVGMIIIATTEKKHGSVVKVLLEPGDAILVPAGISHGIENTGNEILKVIVLWGPPQKEKPYRGSWTPSSANIISNLQSKL